MSPLLSLPKDVMAVLKQEAKNDGRITKRFFKL